MSCRRGSCISEDVQDNWDNYTKVVQKHTNECEPYGFVKQIFIFCDISYVVHMQFYNNSHILQKIEKEKKILSSYKM